MTLPHNTRVQQTVRLRARHERGVGIVCALAACIAVPSLNCTLGDEREQVDERLISDRFPLARVTTPSGCSPASAAGPTRCG